MILERLGNKIYADEKEEKQGKHRNKQEGRRSKVKKNEGAGR